MRTTIGKATRVALLFCVGAWGQAWAVATLQEVKVNPLMADQLLLELSFSEPVSGFTDRLSYEPNQLLLHVPGAVGALNVNPLPIKQQGVDNLKVEGKGAGLDIKIALDQLTPYQVHQQGNKLLVALGGQGGHAIANHSLFLRAGGSPADLIRPYQYPAGNLVGIAQQPAACPPECSGGGAGCQQTCVANPANFGQWRLFQLRQRRGFSTWQGRTGGNFW